MGAGSRRGEIVRYRDVGDAFYAVASGQLHTQQGGLLLRRLAAGDYFGEIALLRYVPRTATVKAITPASLFRVPRVVFDRVLRKAFEPNALIPHVPTGHADRRLVHP